MQVVSAGLGNSRQVAEEWRAVVGFEGSYEVSNLGRVRSLTRDIWCSPTQTRKGYWSRRQGRVLRPGQFNSHGHVSVVLRHGTDGIPVHFLVATAFIGPRPKGLDILHRNGVGADNRSENLRYGTRSENNRDIAAHGRRRLTFDQVRALRALRAEGATYVELAKKFGVCQSQAFNIASGKHYVSA